MKGHVMGMAAVATAVAVTGCRFDATGAAADAADDDIDAAPGAIDAVATDAGRPGPPGRCSACSSSTTCWVPTWSISPY